MEILWRADKLKANDFRSRNLDLQFIINCIIAEGMNILEWPRRIWRLHWENRWGSRIRYWETGRNSHILQVDEEWEVSSLHLVVNVKTAGTAMLPQQQLLKWVY